LSRPALTIPYRAELARRGAWVRFHSTLTGALDSLKLERERVGRLPSAERDRVPPTSRAGCATLPFGPHRGHRAPNERSEYAHQVPPRAAESRAAQAPGKGAAATPQRKAASRRRSRHRESSAVRSRERA